MSNIMKYINRISRICEADRAKFFKNYNISGNQVSYLIAIKKNPGITQESLAENLFVNKSTVARNIATLIEQEYIYRQEDEKDKRIFRVYPTEKLEKIIPILKKYLKNWSNDVTKDLTKEEIDIFEDILKKVAIKAKKRLEE